MEENKLISKSFLWMFIGLLVTFITGYGVSLNETMALNVFGTYYIFLVIAELILVIVLSARVMKMKPTTAKVCFLLYSFVSGLTFSSIFIVFGLSSIMTVFLVTAIIFALMSLIGYKTSVNLSKVGTYLFFGLLAVILVSIVNLFVGNSMLELILSIICVIIFVGITAYDVQKIKSLESSGLPTENLAIYGALDLYLDFINLFIHLLQILGRNRN